MCLAVRDTRGRLSLNPPLNPTRRKRMLVAHRDTAERGGLPMPPSPPLPKCCTLRVRRIVDPCTPYMRTVTSFGLACIAAPAAWVLSLSRSPGSLFRLIGPTGFGEWQSKKSHHPPD
ncbi:hypothetical protein LY76DRAFT_215691 [Colletotrichum caudatum]|nr:hypothetical protein LY76DRAFT_215691 [Colletotrichum caudatum]